MMKKIFILSLIFLCFSCKKNPTTRIQTEYLKADWITPNNDYFFVEDSIILTNIIHVYGCSSYKYCITNDSIILHRINKTKSKSIFKIIELTKNKFSIQFLKATTDNNTYIPNQNFNFRLDTLLRNTKSIKTLEFSSTNCLGDTPTIDLKIDCDSMLYIMGYNHNSNFLGLYQHKLTKSEYERIIRKVSQIKLDLFSIKGVPPDASSYSLRIEMKNNTILKSQGSLSSIDDYWLVYFVEYLMNLDRLLNFEKSKDENLKIHYIGNKNLFNKK